MHQKEVVLAPFPFTDQTDSKIRPALVISTNHMNNGEDVIIAAITSKKTPNTYSIPLTDADFTHGRLLAESSIRYSHLVTVKKTLIIRTVAKLSEKKWKEVQKELQKLFL